MPLPQWTQASRVHRWGRWEAQFTSSKEHVEPLLRVALLVELTAPSGTRHTVPAFWDDGRHVVARGHPLAPAPHHAGPRRTISAPALVARAALFLSRDDSSVTTGSAFFVNGGLTAQYQRYRYQ